MDFWDLTKLLFRRWYISGPLLLLTFGGVAFAVQRIEPDYVATSYVQLVPPSVTPKQSDGKAPQPRNPWLDLGTSSLGKAGILTVQDQRVVKVLKKAGYSEDFTLTLDSSLPIVTFEVIGDSKAQAASTTEELIKRFNSSVATLQNEYGAAKDQSITTRQLDLGDNVTESTAKVKRALVAIGAVGLLLTIALTIAFDALLRRRKRDASAPAGTEQPTRTDDAPAPTASSIVRVVADRRTAVLSRPRGGIEYKSRSADSGTEGVAVVAPDAVSAKAVVPGEETVVVLSPPGEKTVMIPTAGKNGRRNGHANGSKHP